MVCSTLLSAPFSALSSGDCEEAHKPIAAEEECRGDAHTHTRSEGGGRRGRTDTRWKEAAREGVAAVHAIQSATRRLASYMLPTAHPCPLLLLAYCHAAPGTLLPQSLTESRSCRCCAEEHACTLHHAEGSRRCTTIRRIDMQLRMHATASSSPPRARATELIFSLQQAGGISFVEVGCFG